MAVLIGANPKMSSRDKIQEHLVTHLPHQKWCRHCVEGRMIKDQSFTVPKEDRLARDAVVIQIDYFEFEATRILMMVETTSCFMAARVVENKSYTGQMDQKVSMVADFILFIG